MSLIFSADLFDQERTMQEMISVFKMKIAREVILLMVVVEVVRGNINSNNNSDNSNRYKTRQKSNKICT